MDVLQTPTPPAAALGASKVEKVQTVYQLPAGGLWSPTGKEDRKHLSSPCLCLFQP